MSSKKSELINAPINIKLPNGEQKPLKLKKRRDFHWTYEQNQIFLRFIKDHQQQMAKKQTKRSRVFKKFSEMVKNKTPIQVKTHHQKLQQKYKNIKGVIGYLQKLLALVHQNEKSMKESQKSISEEILCENIAVQCQIDLPEQIEIKPLQELEDQIVCDSYELPNITEGIPIDWYESLI